MKDSPGQAGKQKVMLVITVLLFIVLGYLLYTTFFKGKSSSTSTSTPTINTTAVSSNTPSAGCVSPATNNVPQVTLANVKSGSFEAGGEPSPEEKEILKHTKEVEQEYLKLVGEYQLAQLQQKLAQVNAQTAESKLAAMKAMSEVKKFDIQTASTAGKMNGTTIIGEIKALYAGYGNGVWTGMLNLDGALYQVKVGTELPNGAVVSSISDNGIVLNQKGQRTYLPIPTHMDKPPSKTAQPS